MTAKKTPSQKENEITDLPEVNECFIITPIGDVGSPVHIKAMGLIKAVIEPVLSEIGFKPIAAHQISDTGSINNQIIKRILEDKLVIANLTGLNPNVMYELAIRHAARKPVIIMAQYDTPLPFDIKDQRTILYTDTLAGVEGAKETLRSLIESSLKEEKPDNPIYQAAERESIFQGLKSGDPLKVIMERLDRIEQGTANRPRQFGFQSKGIDMGHDQVIFNTNPQIAEWKAKFSGHFISTPGHNRAIQNQPKYIEAMLGINGPYVVIDSKVEGGRFNYTVLFKNPKDMATFRERLSSDEFISLGRFDQSATAPVTT